MTKARAAAQRVKLNAKAELREQGAAEAKEAAALKKARGKKEQRLQASRRANTTMAHAVDSETLLAWLFRRFRQRYHSYGDLYQGPPARSVLRSCRRAGPSSCSSV